MAHAVERIELLEDLIRELQHAPELVAEILLDNCHRVGISAGDPFDDEDGAIFTQREDGVALLKDEAMALDSGVRRGAAVENSEGSEHRLLLN